MTKSKNILYFIAVLAAISVIFFVSRNEKNKPVSTPSPFVFISPTATPQKTNLPSPTPKTTLTPEQIQQAIKDYEKKMNGGFDIQTADYTKLNGPAVCQLSGSVDFYNHDTASNNSFFTYTGADSGADQITWKISPADHFQIGPNMGASLLVLPDGKQQLAVVLPANPISKHYALTASMSYGRLIDEAIRTAETQCTGQVEVNLNY